MDEQTQMPISDSTWVTLLGHSPGSLCDLDSDSCFLRWWVSFYVDNIVLLQFKEQKEINIELRYLGYNILFLRIQDQEEFILDSPDPLLSLYLIYQMSYFHKAVTKILTVTT